MKQLPYPLDITSPGPDQVKGILRHKVYREKSVDWDMLKKYFPKPPKPVDPVKPNDWIYDDPGVVILPENNKRWSLL